MHSTQQHAFSRIPQANIPRSTFQRTHGFKTTFDSGYLVPFFLDEVLPGDTFSVKATLFGRLATPAVPVMDNLFLDAFFFFVPNRLVWEHWVNFMGEQNNPEDPYDWVIPRLEAGSTPFPVHSLPDYFGLPLAAGQSSEISALPFRAYNLIWNEWFRDENLQDPLPCLKNDGPDAFADYSTFYNSGGYLARRNKRHDYFTSCLPWPQKGPGVMLPLGVSAPILPAETNVSAPTFFSNGGSNVALTTATGDELRMYSQASGGQTVRWGDPGLIADLSQASAATINSLRQAFQIQKLYERDARGGTRYTEIVRSHFGVISPDARLQRPEYLGGGTVRINITPVAQTSGSPLNTGGYTTTPQGNLAAFGTMSGNIGFTKSFVEHGMVMGLMSVRADLTYQQGIDRMWTRHTRFDYYWPALAHIGEQAVLQKEIFFTNDPVADNKAWGYQERWAEYRYKRSLITGKLRSENGLPPGETSLDKWHLAEDFYTYGTPPSLNGLFIQSAPPVERVIAVQDEPQFILDSYIDARTTRPMPVYSVPGMIDHF